MTINIQNNSISFDGKTIKICVGFLDSVIGVSGNVNLDIRCTNPKEKGFIKNVFKRLHEKDFDEEDDLGILKAFSVRNEIFKGIYADEDNDNWPDFCANEDQYKILEYLGVFKGPIWVKII